MTTATIFTPIQARRNRKAIDAAIAEHGATLTATSIPVIADEMASKYAWEVRRNAYHAEIVRALEDHYAANSGMTKRTEVAAERVAAKRAANVMASRAPVADEDDYTIATTDGVVIAQVQHINLTDSDDPDGDTISRLEDALADANAEIERLQDKHIAIEKELQEVRDELDDAREEIKQHEEYKTEAETWRKAWDFLEDIQDHAAHAVPVVSAIDRATLQLSYDGWDDQYVQQDIADAMEAALNLSRDAADLYDTYEAQA